MASFEEFKKFSQVYKNNGYDSAVKPLAPKAQQPKAPTESDILGNKSNELANMIQSEKAKNDPTSLISPATSKVIGNSVLWDGKVRAPVGQTLGSMRYNPITNNVNQALPPSLDNMARTVTSFGLGAANTATLGLQPLTDKILQPEQYSKQKALTDDYQFSNFLGKMAGYLVPGVAGTKLTAPLFEGLGQGAGRFALQEGLVGMGTGAVEGLTGGLTQDMRGMDLLNNVAKDAVYGGAFGALLGGGIPAMGELAGATKKALSIDSAFDDIFGGYKPSIEGTGTIDLPKMEPSNIKLDKAKMAREKFGFSDPATNDFRPSKVDGNINSPTNKTSGLKGQINANEFELHGKPYFDGTVSIKPKEFRPESAEAATNKIKSDRQLPEIHKMSKQEFDIHYGLDKAPNNKAVENIIEDLGARVINKVGSKDIPTIVKHYQAKYDLPENIKVSFTLKKSSVKGATNPIRDGNGNIAGYRININPNQSIEGRIGSLRHEIEHMVDLQKGYTSPTSKYKFNPKIDRTGRALFDNASKGHHKNYGWFEPDYLRRAEIKDAIKQGKEVPESVLKDYPDLMNYKPLKGNVDVVAPNEVKTAKAPIKEEPMRQATKQPTKEPIMEPSPKTKEPTANNKEKFKVFDEDEAVKNERGFSKNVRTDSNMNDDIRKTFDETPLEYDKLSNKKTLAKAEEELKRGYEVALRRFEMKDAYSPEDVPLARMLANEAAKRGDIQTARRVISIIAEKLTESGQFSQAARILRRSDPSAFVEFIQRKVLKLNEQGKKLYGDKWKDLQLPDDKMKEIYKLELIDETKMEKLMNDIGDNLTEQMPVSKMEKFDAWRRMAMLLNPKTHIRNIVGNAGMMGLRKFSDTIAVGFEKVFLKEGQRTKSIGWSRDKDLVKAVNENWNTLKEDLMSGGRWDIESINVMNKEKRIFNNNVLEAVNNFSKKTLEKEDEFFMARAYKDALGQYMKANKLTAVTDEAINYAQRRALEATFRQVNALSKLITQAKQVKGWGKLVEAAIPFSKTPSNIAMRAIDYSPAGLIKALFTKGYFKDSVQAIEELSKGLTGTALLGLGYYLSSLGWARADRSKSKNAEGLMQVSGEKPFSIITSLGSYAFDWAQPFAIPLAMGITFNESLKNNLKADKSLSLDKAITDSIYAGGDTLFNMTMLKNIKDLFGGKYGSTSEAIASLPSDYLEQAFPTIFGQVARSVDRTVRSTYDPSPIKSAVKGIVAKTPFASKMLEPKVDILGREMKQNDPVSQFLNPGAYAEKTGGQLVRELNRVYDKTKGDSSFLPKVAPTSFTFEGKTIRLSPKEVTTFQKEMGQLNKEVLSQVINSNDYLTATTYEDKAKLIKRSVEDNYDVAKRKLLEKRGIITEEEQKFIPIKTLKSVGRN